MSTNRRYPLVLVALGLTAAVSLSADSVSAATESYNIRLDKWDEEVLAYANARDVETLIVHLIVQAGRKEAIRSFAKTLPQSRIVASHDPAGWLAILVRRQDAGPLLRVDGIEAATIELPESNKPIDEQKSEAFLKDNPGVAERVSATKPTAEKPRTEFSFEAGGGSVLKELNAEQWRADNPTFDGRGVTIGFVEGIADVSAPELQEAYDLDGRPARKVVDSVPTAQIKFALDGKRDIMDYRWSSFDGAARHGNRYGKLRLPGRLAKLDGLDICRPEAVVMSDLGVRAFRSGVPEEMYEYLFRWNAKSRKVQVDDDCDGSFENEDKIGIFSESGQLIQLGKSSPQSKLKGSISIAIAQSPGFDGLVFMSAVSSHASMTSGAAVANRRPSGRIDGVAPGSKIIYFEHSPSILSFANAIIATMSDPRVDIVLVEAYSLLVFTHFRDGSSVQAILMDKLAKSSGKPVFLTGTNGIGMSQVADPCAGNSIICIGTYHSRRSVAVAYGLDKGIEDNLGEVGASGPSGNGALAPGLLAPNNPKTITLRFGDGPRLSAQPVGLHVPTIGYSTGGGTSVAGPVAAGAAALLLSAARQSGIDASDGRLAAAMLGSARYLDLIDAYHQGRGVIDVAAAYDLLKKGAAEPIEIEVAAPVRTMQSHELRVPHEGVGLFEREGWNAGDRATRIIKLTRRTGPAGDMAFDVKWKSRKMLAFSSQRTIVLPLDKTIEIPVQITANGTGAHSGILSLVSQRTGVSMKDVGVTIVAPETFTVANGFAVRAEVTLPPIGRAATFFRVPAGAKKFIVNLSRMSGEPSAQVYSPSGKYQPWWVELDRKDRDSMTVDLPEAGVWELQLNDYHHTRTYDPTDSVGIAKPTRMAAEIILEPGAR